MNAANILVVDDEADIRTLIEEILSDEGYAVQTAADASEARQQIGATKPDLVLLDVWMPDTDGITLLNEWSRQGELRCPVVIMSGHGTVETAVEATRLGAADFIEKPLSLAKLLRTVEKALDHDQSAAGGGERSLMPPMLAPVGKSAKIQALREQVEQIARLDTPVALLGEPGTGREAFARYLHARSGRRDMPFVNLVAATFTPENAAQLLLGSGGAPGFIEQAQGGILFINELEEMPEEGQRLIRGIVEQGSYARLGSAEQVPLDIRIVVSVPPAGVSDPQRFGLREDLVDRVSISQLRIPALRDYPEDVSELLRHFVDRFVDDSKLPFRKFSVAAQNRLRNYPWPGNIRELSALVQRLLNAQGSEQIGLEELEAQLEPVAAGEESLLKKDLLSLPLREAREHFERAYLTEQLTLCGGKVGQLAKRVGMERTHLYRKLRSLGVDFRQANVED